MSRVVSIQGAVQHYAWGKNALSSSVARFASASGHQVVSGKPYAELWMGTHPSGPATLLSGKKLSEFITENQGFMGNCPSTDSQNPLPFLMKVLSINQALSIQAHPDKDLATVLHRTNPDAYKDDNHKPELICAITPFEGLCGFRALTEIQHFFGQVPELSLVADASLLSNLSDNEQEQKSVLKKLYTSLMHASQDSVEKATSSLVSRLESGSSGLEPSLQDVILRVHKDYPNDIGLFSIFFLNYVKLVPGEALFLAANEPHAYIFGEGVEIMACSDNVVRAGLTPKFKDVQVLCDMLTYNHGPAQILTGEKINGHTRRYTTPVDEFQLLSYTIGHEHGLQDLLAFDMPQILLVVSGEGTTKSDSSESINLAAGSILFVAASERLQISPTGEHPLIVYASTCGNAKQI